MVYVWILEMWNYEWKFIQRIQGDLNFFFDARIMVRDCHKNFVYHLIECVQHFPSVFCNKILSFGQINLYGLSNNTVTKLFSPFSLSILSTINSGRRFVQTRFTRIPTCNRTNSHCLFECNSPNRINGDAYTTASSS